MHQITVQELLKLLNQEKYADYYYERLEFYGGNEHLENPLNNDPYNPVPYVMTRDEQHYLKGDDIIYGDYLIFEEYGHDGYAALFQYDTLFQIQKHIARGGSYTNTFTDNTVVIVKGEVKPFAIKGYDRHGNEHTHVKYENDHLFGTDVNCFWVEWLDEEKEPSELEKHMQYGSALDVVMTRFQWKEEKERLLDLIQNLHEGDKNEFLSELDTQMEKQIKVTEEFKQGLRKQPES